MRSIFFAIILLLASTAVVGAAQAEKRGFAQALNSHRQPMLVGQSKPNGADEGRFDEDALTRRIEHDTARLDRLVEICSGC